MAHPFPVAMTANLPFVSVSHAALPVIFIQNPETGEATLCRHTVKWASGLSESQGPISVRQHIATVCRFTNFYHLFSYGQSLSIHDQTMSLWSYMDFRGTGTKYLDENHLLYPLLWDGVAKTTISSEFKHLIRYFTFLETYTGPDAQFLDRTLFRLPKAQVQDLKDSTDDFFAHLASHRDYWRDLRENENLRPPAKFRVPPRRKGFKPFPPEEEILEIIAGEKNPTFKAIWLLLAYGASHRISEVLNLWQVDILPSSYNREFFGLAPDGFPLVLIADPSNSSWLGDFNSGRVNRAQYLLSEYGLRPRPERSANDPLFSGFKTKKVYGEYQVAKTWWLNENAASAFSECAAEIQNFHLRHRTSRKHPYFFVNMFARDDRLGEPLTKKRIQAAWADACRRVGITPHVRGRNIHGLRHFTKYYMEELQLSPSDIQIMRGDHSIASQDEYGQCAAKVSKALERLKNAGAMTGD